MSKIKISSIPLMLGCINWIMLIIMIIVLSIDIIINPKVTPKAMYPIEDFLGYYLKYSCLPSLIGIYLSIKFCKENRLKNFAINAVYLFIYILFFLFFWFIASRA